ncbi:fumarylacetoacetase [Martelella soudanensis]|uniref:fumarylacetoacetase n=1 Tax=unclassified Martelella TaxID=2629616 RepID=UPI0015DFD07F|nr:MULTISPECIES: fumarylacetoacetase [unclassified Martelella]
MPLLKSWVESANAPNGQFPLNNLPYGVFSTSGDARRCGVAIGDQILDVTALEQDAHLSISDDPVFVASSWNAFMALGPEVWRSFRARLQAMLGTEASQADREACSGALVPQADATMHLPVETRGYADFYGCRNHAFNVGTMFRGPDNALPPNYLHLPIAYSGRASSIVISGTEIRRPWGQLKAPEEDAPRFAPCERFDFELELGVIVGQPSEFGRPVSVAKADEMIFGYVLLNDWSARDIQTWEYQPLGPFQAKATANTISPWIVTGLALEPLRVSTPEREKPLLPHLQEPGPMLYDIDLEVLLLPDGADHPTTITQSNYSEMYYSAPQNLAHHTTSGCPIEVGDMLGSGTISGTTRKSRGSLLELSWGGTEPVEIDGGITRSFIEDNDTIIMRGSARGDGYLVGFGQCTGKVLAAYADPYSRD